jgi:hypothetical protein
MRANDPSILDRAVCVTDVAGERCSPSGANEPAKLVMPIAVHATITMQAAIVFRSSRRLRIDEFFLVSLKALSMSP